MTKKHLLPILLAMLMLPSLPVHAVENWEDYTYYPNFDLIDDSVDFFTLEDAAGLVPTFDDSTMVDHAIYNNCGFYIPANGTEIPTEALDAIPHLRTYSLTAWNEGNYYDCPFAVGEQVYHVILENGSDVRTIARQFSLEQGLTEVYFERVMTENQVKGPWNLKFITKDASIELDVSDFSQLASLTEYDSLSGTAWRAELHDDIAEARDALYDVNSVESYEYTMAIAADLLAEHSDVLEAVVGTPASRTMELCEYSKFQSIWAFAGDGNADGEINAKDAAEVLQAAANAAVSRAAADTVGDVNMDGRVGADDASLILIYAAERSAGNDVAWLDLLNH